MGWRFAGRIDKGNEMKAILRRLPIIRAIIARREQAALEAQAAESFAAFMKHWDSLSPEQAWRAAGCPSQADVGWMMRDQAS
jgi:hypothetical protein